MKTLPIIIDNNLYSLNHTSFNGIGVNGIKGASVIPSKAVEQILETTLSVAAAYGIYQTNKKEGEKPPYIETKEGKNIISIKLNQKGEEEYRTVIKPSNIVGEYNITQIYPNGEKKILSSVKSYKSGYFDIQKEFVSPSGMHTFYKRTGTHDDYSLSYVIKDEKGNIKLDFKRSFKKIDNNTTESIVNGVRHINTFDVLGVESVNQADLNDKNFMIINWQFEDNMRKLPAEIFYCLQKNKIRILTDDYKNEKNAYVEGNLLNLSTYLRNDFFVFAHEVGHIKSNELGNLSKEKDLQEIFEQERQEALKNLGKILQKEAEDFLINPFRLDEVIAEAYAILSGLDHNNIESNHSIRTNILMQYFPNTIAYIASKMF